MEKYEIDNLSLNDEFFDIKRSGNIPDMEFAESLRFAMLITEGKSKEEAYNIVFCVGSKPEKSFLSFKANALLRRKYVQDILNRLIMTNHIVFADKHYNALNELYSIGLYGNSEKNRVEALKAFIDATKRPDVKIDANLTINIGSEMIDKLESQIGSMAQKAKLIKQSGDIIDVDTI
jgi:hypothetical protein